MLKRIFERIKYTFTIKWLYKSFKSNVIQQFIFLRQLITFYFIKTYVVTFQAIGHEKSTSPKIKRIIYVHN